MTAGIRPNVLGEFASEAEWNQTDVVGKPGRVAEGSLVLASDVDQLPGRGAQRCGGANGTFKMF